MWYTRDQYTRVWYTRVVIMGQGMAYIGGRGQRRAGRGGARAHVQCHVVQYIHVVM